MNGAAEQIDTPADSQTAPADGPVQDNRAAAESIVKNSVIAAMSVGLIPIPAVGLLGLVATNVTMLQSISKLYGVPFKQELARSAVFALVGGLLPVSLGVGFSELLKLIPGFGSVAGAAGTSVLAGAVTYGVGRTFVEHFEEGGTFLSLDIARLRKTFTFEFNRGRKVAEEMAPAAEKPAAEKT